MPQLSDMELEHSFGIGNNLFLEFRIFHFSMSVVSRSRLVNDGAAPAADI